MVSQAARTLIRSLNLQSYDELHNIDNNRTVHKNGTVLVQAKHIGSRDHLNSSVLYGDIATTIDGGEGAAGVDQTTILASCLKDGGTLGVRVNLTNPAYKSASYNHTGYTPDGILIKLVHS